MSSDAPVRADSIPVRPAATVMLVRDGDDGLEVFMLQRTHGAAFARSQYVFPGGKVDDADHGEVFEPICDGLDDETASSTMGLDYGGLAWLAANPPDSSPTHQPPFRPEAPRPATSASMTITRMVGSASRSE